MGKKVVALSDLHNILVEIADVSMRDKVFEQIYDRGQVIDIKDVFESVEKAKWNENNKEKQNSVR
jgi:hypothetical protein